MEKLPMCRICLAENVRMYIVVNRNLHKLYEKLTDIPFVTEDSRPILACFFCCAKLKQCYRLLRKCLEAEELFTQMMNEDYEPKLLNQGHEFYSGFIQSSIVHLNIDSACQTESIAIKEELPAVCEGLDDIIEPKEEPQSEELEPENLDNSCLDVADIQPHHSESDLEDDVPLMEIKIEVEEEQEVFTKIRRARETIKLEPENLDNSCLDVADITPHHSESDSEDDVPLMEFKTEVEEEQDASKMKQRVRETKRMDVAQTPKLEDGITAEQTSKDKSDSKVIQTTQKRTSKPGTYLKEPYKCDQRTFNRVKKVIQHTRTHIGKKPNKCDVCQRSFREKGALTKHIRIHSGEKSFMCDVCQHSFSRKCELTNHIRIHTDIKPYMCDVCQRNFSEKGVLIKHIRIHTGEKPFKCDVCQRSFRHKVNLTTHIRTHTGEKLHKCDVCQRCFSRKCELTNHVRIHTDVKPYKCDVCQRIFSQKGNLLQHIRTHTGEKPYKCDICQRCFAQNSDLTKHIRIHTGEKPYNCDVCHRSFCERGTLKKHMLIHTGVKPYNCDVCQRTFRKKGNLTKHIRIHYCHANEEYNNSIFCIFD